MWNNQHTREAYFDSMLGEIKVHVLGHSGDRVHVMVMSHYHGNLLWHHGHTMWVPKSLVSHRKWDWDSL